MWWHHHPLFELSEKGFSKPRKGRENEYNEFNEMRERAAWTYELVRRLGLLLRRTKTEFHARDLPSVDVLRTLEGMPIYVELPCAWQDTVGSSVKFCLGIRPVTIHPDLLPKTAKDYAELPKCAFDLTASEERLKAHFLLMISSLMAARGLTKERRNKHLSKNKDKPRLSPRWDQLDFVCDPTRFKGGDSKPERLAGNLERIALSQVEAVALGMSIAIQEEQLRSASTRKPVWWCSVSIPKVPIQIRPVMSAFSTTRYPCAEHLLKILRGRG